MVVSRILTWNRMLADADYFSSRISKIDGAGDLGEHIVNVVNAKPVVSEPSSAKKASIESSRNNEKDAIDEKKAVEGDQGMASKS